MSSSSDNSNAGPNRPAPRPVVRPAAQGTPPPVGVSHPAGAKYISAKRTMLGLPAASPPPGMEPLPAAPPTPAPIPATPRPPSIPTRVEVPTGLPPLSASAKAPPPPKRQPPPPPSDDDDDDDEAPTAMFVHSVKYTYDPDAPPPSSVFDDDDDEEDEPPTAIHVSPYRGEGTPFPGGVSGLPGPPLSFASPPQPGPNPSSIPARPPPAAGAPVSAQPFLPAGVGVAAMHRPAISPRSAPTMQLSAVQMHGQTGSGMITPTGHPVGAMDPDAAPVWLKAIALSSVVSALVVLVVLGWMLFTRFSGA